jgi:carbon-monoxide dehydrogenase large subunit
MLNASRDIIDKGIKIASHVLEAATTDLEFVEGRFAVKADRSLGIFRLQQSVEAGNDLPDDLRGPLCAEATRPSTSQASPTAAMSAGRGRPRHRCRGAARYTAVDDVGAPSIDDRAGQIHGGITHGVGQAMSEYCVYDQQTGQLLSGSLLDYAMPRAGTLPFFTTELSEVPTPTAGYARQVKVGRPQRSAW